MVPLGIFVESLGSQVLASVPVAPSGVPIRATGTENALSLAGDALTSR